MNAGPLTGIRVVDLTTFLSGPFCTQILADLGAEVVKVEALDGDSSRGIPPYFVEGESAYFLAHNRSKSSIAIDLKRPEGQAVARRLVASADVVVENFRPGVSARLGLDPQAMRAADPALVWVSISGFGQSGPRRERPAYDIIVQALSGVMSLTGVPGGPAMRLGVPAGDLAAGMYAVMAVTAALVERTRTGMGAWADVSMLDGQLSLLSYQAVYSTVGGITPQPQASRHDSIPTYRTFRCADDREIAVAANTQRMWIALCEAIGSPDLPRDPRFADGAGRLRHEEALAPLLEGRFAERPAAHWADELVARSVPAALIENVPEALADAREAGRGMVVPVISERGSVVETVGLPIRFVGHEPPSPAYPPRLGEHSVDVLREIGLDTTAIAQLVEAGVVLDGGEPAP
ncbi:MAG: CoA transferase [Microbacterium sp.]|uniref:CaiB/BaiF CoA transferase family protein n=1 Tax=Microbacterium sp. TaxID=51671 RepID=UPI0039E45E02